MPLVCKRLPATEETLRFISPFFAKPHIQKALDDRWRSAYGIYDLFRAIREGKYRAYGVFELDEGNKVTRFMGFELGWLDATKETFEHHAFWDRAVDAVPCVTLCKNFMKEEFAHEGIVVKSCVGYIPESNRAAIRMAKRAGCSDLGFKENTWFLKNGYWFPCRELRINL